MRASQLSNFQLQKVLCDGRNGGAWFRITEEQEVMLSSGDAESTTLKTRTDLPVRPSSAFLNGRLTVQIEAAHGCQSADASFFATNPV